MDNKKDNKYYIKKIVTDLAFIIKHTDGRTRSQLDLHGLHYVTADSNL